MESLRENIFLKSGSCEAQALKTGPLTLVHGGAGPADPKGEFVEQARQALSKILQSIVGEKKLSSQADWLRDQGRYPTKAAQLAVLGAAEGLEREPLFNAGIGGVLQEDGLPRLSASFMDNQRRHFSAVINGRDYPYASLLAYYLQWEKHSLRDAQGFEDLLRNLNLTKQPLVTPQKFQRWVDGVRKISRVEPRQTGSHGTIGSVAVSAQGDLAAVTSTGGVGLEPRGRVGDTPSIAGNYCGQRVAISCTGRGEEIIDLGLAIRVGAKVDEGGQLATVLGEVLEEGLGRKMSLAAIAVARDNNGRCSWALGSTAPTFLWGLAEGGKSLVF